MRAGSLKTQAPPHRCSVWSKGSSKPEPGWLTAVSFAFGKKCLAWAVHFERLWAFEAAMLPAVFIRTDGKAESLHVPKKGAEGRIALSFLTSPNPILTYIVYRNQLVS